MDAVLDMAILETKDLTKSFGALTAVSGVSLAVEAGSLHSIIGPNGAGKTTLFNLLTGTFPPTSGRIIFDQKEITGTPANRIAHLGLARSYQRTTVFPAFSIFDNVWVSSYSTSGRSGLAWRNANDYPEVTERSRQALSDVGLLDKENNWRASFPTASSASSSWRSRSPPRRACCCWTSRPRASRPRRRAAWWRWCAR
jgi:branched-chain amino acid transport system ATP-binding protein